MTVKEVQYLRQKVRQRITRIRDVPGRSQVSVKAYDNLSEYLQEYPTWSKMSERQFNTFSRELERIDKMPSSTVTGSKETFKHQGEFWGEEKYNNLDTDSQSALWHKFTEIQNEYNNDLDSDQVRQLVEVSEIDNKIGFEIKEDKFNRLQIKLTYNGKKIDGRTREGKTLNRFIRGQEAYSTSDFSSVLYKAINRR